MLDVNESNYTLRKVQVETLSKLMRVAQACSRFHETPECEPMGELLRELAMSVARYESDWTRVKSPEQMILDLTDSRAQGIAISTAP